MIPNDSTVRGRYIDQLDPEGISHEIVGEHCGSLQTSICPSRSVGVGNVELCDSYSVDFVGGLGNGALDRLLVVLGEDGGHFERSSRVFALFVWAVSRVLIEC